MFVSFRHLKKQVLCNSATLPFPYPMLKWLILIAAIALMLSSCARNLLQDINLSIDDQPMQFYYGAGDDIPNYFHNADSAAMRLEIINGLKDDFSTKGNDVTLVPDTGRYTLQILSCSFHESVYTHSIVNPCDSSAFPDSLHYSIHSLDVSMHCILKDHLLNLSQTIEAEAQDEEELKDGPTFWQSLFHSEDCNCYEPHIKAITFYDKLRRRVLRRIHQRALSQVKSWQRY